MNVVREFMILTSLRTGAGYGKPRLVREDGDQLGWRAHNPGECAAARYVKARAVASDSGLLSRKESAAPHYC
jgi:hypothetical protein